MGFLLPGLSRPDNLALLLGHRVSRAPFVAFAIQEYLLAVAGFQLFVLVFNDFLDAYDLTVTFDYV